MGKTLSITTRLIALQALMAVGLLGLLAMNQFAFQRTERDLQSAERSQREARLAQGVETGILAHKQALDRYVLARDADSQARVDGIQRSAAADVATLNNADLSAPVLAYLATTATIRERVETLGITENNGLQLRLRTAVRTVEKRFDEIRADSIGTRLEVVNQMMVLLLQMRRHEKDYMLRGERARYMGQIAERRKEFLEILKTAPLLDRLKEEVTRLLEDYVTAVNAFADGTDALAAARADSDAKFDAAATRARAVEAAAFAAADKDRDAVLTTQDDVHTLLMASVAGLLAALSLGGYLIGRSITIPVRRLTALMGVMAQGDYDSLVSDQDRGDEVGAMARAVGVFRDNGLETRRLRALQEEEQAKAEAAKLAALEAMATTVESESRLAVNRVAEQTRRMDDSAAAMADSAAHVSADSQSVAAAAEQALSNAQTVAAATEQLSASIREISAQVAQASDVSQRAAEQGRATQDSVRSLSSAVDQIGEVAVLIQRIAQQTNLLALNATIEAARAGEAGKGFAVVASEVKNLANQTAGATEDIGRRIAEIQAVTNGTVTAVDNIGRSIAEIDQVSAAIAAAMEEQSSATQEIARNVQETSVAVQEVSRRITEVSTEADATGQHASTVREVAASVSGSIDSLRGTLVRVVRTATQDVDRRRQPRFAVQARARVEGVGAPRSASVLNLSEGGATLRLEPGERLPGDGVLRVDGVPLALPFLTLSQDGADAHVRFQLNPADDEAYRAAFRRLTAGLTPINRAA